jgi:hypothetical protein
MAMFDSIINAWNQFTAWLVDLFSGLVDAISSMLYDLFLFILDGFLSGIASIVEAIPVPDFANYGLSYYLTAVDPSVLYFLDRIGLAQALSMLGAGLAFRLLRKLVTLGNW